MDYYRMMQLADMIDADLVTPSQYINWADKIIISVNEPDYIVLELCVERSSDKAIAITRKNQKSGSAKTIPNHQ